jgi:alanyl-tRNA synthetase
MSEHKPSGNQIRQDFIDFFIEHIHTYVPSSSLVPGGDQTLLFTNAGMVQFKDVFLGTDTRPYTRATNSQKCMRVAGKHNDLDDVGRDGSHHTFFEMLGNWSFGDYYKKEAITWAWQLLTEVWGLPKESLYSTVFKDEKGEVETDDEAAYWWKQQPGFNPDHLLYFGRKDNFWEMADTGPCGPCSEIHIDRGPKYCDKPGVPGHICQVNGDCTRFLELWNLVFIQYNRINTTTLEPLPAKHVDTGMGFERIVSVLQDVDQNYHTDLFWPSMQTIQQLAGHTDEEREADLTPYRVICDHARAAAFLIADGVVPGNVGRNYVTRMIIRRAARFGNKIGLDEPFLAQVADKFIETYGSFYPELVRNKQTILTNLTREEQRFQRTVESGIAKLENLLLRLPAGQITLAGDQAFGLYATYGLPLEIARDIAREQGYEVDETGFRESMEQHRLASGAGEAFGPLGGEDADFYRDLLVRLQFEQRVSSSGVQYNPYEWLEVEAPVLALITEGETVVEGNPGDDIAILLPKTGFYVESGGQVSDTGIIYSLERENPWEIRVNDVRKPAAGVIVHLGVVVRGHPRLGDQALAQVDAARRMDIMRNHTATHLLHAELRTVLGEHARQAGSLVAPDRLRFDFTHPQALTADELERIEEGVNRAILGSYRLNIAIKPLQQAMSEGAMALFGEKYTDTVRTISIGDEETFSYELCGGTHVDETGDIGIFLITSEGSAAAGIRRIEAITGNGAYELIKRRFQALKKSAQLLATTPDELVGKIENLLDEIEQNRKQVSSLRRDLATVPFLQQLKEVPLIKDIPVLTSLLTGADAETLRSLTDRFKQDYPSGVIVLGSIGEDGRPVLVAAVSDDLVQRGINASELVKFIAQPLGGGGGGKPNLAQAGGKDASRLHQALSSVTEWVEAKLS